MGIPSCLVDATLTQPCCANQACADAALQRHASSSKEYRMLAGFDHAGHPASALRGQTWVLFGDIMHADSNWP
jgi:hypothetical protein